MDDEVQREPVAVRGHRHRIDQEGHVVVDDLDDRMRRCPAMFVDGRIEHAQLGAAGLALAGEVPVGEHRSIQIGGLPLGQILRVDLSEVEWNELLERRPLVRRHLGPYQFQHFVEKLGPSVRVMRVRVHRRLRIRPPRIDNARQDHRSGWPGRPCVFVPRTALAVRSVAWSARSAVSASLPDSGCGQYPRSAGTSVHGAVTAASRAIRPARSEHAHGDLPALRTTQPLGPCPDEFVRHGPRRQVETGHGARGHVLRHATGDERRAEAARRIPHAERGDVGGDDALALAGEQRAPRAARAATTARAGARPPRPASPCCAP